MTINNLSEIIEFNSSFKTAINLYLSLNKRDKILNYIPTKSSISFMDGYLQAVLQNKEQATLLVGPYGKGKSHLLLVIMAILSMERNIENEEVVSQIISKIKSVDEIGQKVAKDVLTVWKDKKRFLPVILNDSKGDLNQAFLFALNDALKRAGLLELVPDTFYSIAVNRLEDWEKNYPNTYHQFTEELKLYGTDILELKTDIKQFSSKALDIFSKIYPKVTSGSVFNPLAVSEVFPLYKSVSEKLVEDYDYSGIYIVFDEFSKFIEGQEGKVIGNNMKLLQDICELSTESQNAQVFITMVAHKSIKEYGKYLSQEIINGFTGIEGRLVEKYFITSSKNNYELIRNAIVKKNDELKSIPEYEMLLGSIAEEKYFQLPVFRSNFKKEDFRNIILYGCYPLSPVAAYLLLNISEKVAQNERTLFTFISNDEPHSMARFVLEHTRNMDWVIGADLIYDYFGSLFKKEISNEMVHNLWLAAEHAISKCDTNEEKKVIKTLAIILIVNKEDEIPADDKYLPLATDILDADEIIKGLVKKELIYKKSSTGEYVFKTRAGSELKAEIKRQRDIKGTNVNYAKSLSQISGEFFVIPRKYNTENYITRYFEHEYLDIETFLSVENAETFFDEDDNADGKVITLYSFSATKQEQVKKHVKELGCKKLVVIAPKQSIKIEKQLRDYEIVQGLRENQAFITNNEIMQRELPLLEEDIIKEVEGVLSSIYIEDDACKIFYFNGEKTKSSKDKSPESAVNICCELLFEKAPRINNEMINRAVISTGQTKRARLNIVQAILEHRDDENFYSGTNQEATIYRSVFVGTGLLKDKEEKNLHEIIEQMNDFIDSCCDKKQTLSRLLKRLTASPYGLRKGVIPIYLAYTFSRRQEDLIIYFADMEVQLEADIVVNMCESPDDYSLFVSKEDIQKEKYISSLRNLFQVKDSRNLTDNRIKDILLCMQRWFRALPQVTRNIANIDSYENNEQVRKNMKTLKRILQKVEYNPFEILFLTLPQEFSTSSLENTYLVIEQLYTAFEDYFIWIQNSAVNAIYDVFGGKKKADLFHVLKEWYDKQSNISKQGLHSGRITNFMSCIEKLNVYSDTEVAKRLVKAVTDVYMENWTESSYKDFINDLKTIKLAIERLYDEGNNGRMKLSFVGKNGGQIERYYDRADEGTGSVLRNVIEDALDEFNDLSVNDRVAILLEMIEKTIR